MPQMSNGPERLDIGADGVVRPSGPWKLYDEKYLFDAKNKYTGKDGQSWKQDLQDYLAGNDGNCGS